jgi:DNA-binding transcriptional MerR regulator
MTSPWLSPASIARATRVSTDTLRHYERKGLLRGVERSAAGHRRYRPDTIGRIRMIQHALMMGFTLGELAAALRQRDKGMPPCRKVRGLIAERLAQLDGRMEQLALLRDEMRAILRDCDRRLASTPRGEPALLLDMLAARPALMGLHSARRALAGQGPGRY